MQLSLLPTDVHLERIDGSANMGNEAVGTRRDPMRLVAPGRHRMAERADDRQPRDLGDDPDTDFVATYQQKRAA